MCHVRGGVGAVTNSTVDLWDGESQSRRGEFVISGGSGHAPESSNRGYFRRDACRMQPVNVNVLSTVAIRRGTEEVITGPTRNRFGGQKLSRGFESHPLRFNEPRNTQNTRKI